MGTKKNNTSKANDVNKGEILMTRDEIINFLRKHGIEFSEDEETFSENSSYSGSFASIYDFQKIGWDTPY